MTKKIKETITKDNYFLNRNKQDPSIYFQPFR